MSIEPVRSVAPDELKDWRKRGAVNSKGGRDRRIYGASHGKNSRAVPPADLNEQGQPEISVDPVGPPRQARELAEILERRRHEMFRRLETMMPEARFEMVRLIRQANPVLLAAYPDDNEAVKHLDTLIRQEAEWFAKRALQRVARDATVIYGGGVIG